MSSLTLVPMFSSSWFAHATFPQSCVPESTRVADVLAALAGLVKLLVLQSSEGHITKSLETNAGLTALDARKSVDRVRLG